MNNLFNTDDPNAVELNDDELEQVSGGHGHHHHHHKHHHHHCGCKHHDHHHHCDHHCECHTTVIYVIES